MAPVPFTAARGRLFLGVLHLLFTARGGKGFLPFLGWLLQLLPCVYMLPPPFSMLLLVLLLMGPEDEETELLLSCSRLSERC